MKTVYVAASLKHKEKAHDLIMSLRRFGFVVTLDWTGLDGCTPLDIAQREKRAVEDADLFVLLLPGGRGAHVEFGMAKTNGATTVIIGDMTAKGSIAFYTLADWYFDSTIDFIKALGC